MPTISKWNKLIGDSTGRRLPRHRPPTHPGEMLLEEFIKSLGLAQTQLSRRLEPISFA